MVASAGRGLSRSSPAGPRRRLLRASAAVLGVLAPLVGAELVLRLHPSAYDGARRMPVDEARPIGRYEPDRAFTWSSDWRFSVVNTVHVNNAGFHSDVDYEAGAPGPLLAVVGDSFVEALMVSYRRTCAGRLATMLEPAARVYSFAMSGASLGQYLAYARFARDAFRPRGLVFVVVDNDYHDDYRDRRLRSTYPAYPGFHHFVDHGDGRLVLERADFVPGLAYRLARRSALLRYLDQNLKLRARLGRLRRTGRFGLPTPTGWQFDPARADESRLARSQRAVEAFFELLPEYSGLGPERVAFVVDGMRPVLYDDEALDAARGSFADAARRHFLATARRLGYETLDLQPRLRAHYREHRRRFEWPQDWHWNALGHERCFDAVRSSALLSDFPRPS